jgi:hypothetical protein
MSTEFLYNSSSFDWLAKEIRRGQARRKNGGKTDRNGQNPKRLEVLRLPVNFSHEAAFLKAKHLRALKFGEWLGSAARRVVQTIANLAAWLNGNNRDAGRVKDFEDHRKAA